MTPPTKAPDSPAKRDETPTTFADLGLPDVVQATLDELGFTAPTPIQAAAIPPLLAGRDLIGRARTGSGKTAAFGLPMMVRVAASLKANPGGPGVRALVLAPTRELALQVTDALRQLGDGLGLSMLTVYGGASYGPQLRGLSRRVPIVVGTPGRLIDLLDRGALDLSAVECFVFDEADEMLAMGFVDEALRLLGETPPERQVALLSATMPAPIRRIADNWLQDPVVVQTDGGRPAVDHIAQRWMAVPQQHKAEALVRLLRAEAPVATLVFLRTRAGCDEVVATLAASGIDALALHGDLTQPAREQVLARLRDERIRVVVATDVAARGLDVEHLGHVVNLDLPDNAEVYTHRIGRTGRAGRAGMATTMVPSSHWRRFLGFAQHLRADVDEIRPPSDAAIAAAQREALLDAVLPPESDDSEENEDFDGVRLDVARRWVDELVDARDVDAREVATHAILRLADERGVAVLADADRTLPFWATSGPGPRNIRGGRLEAPARAGRGDEREGRRPRGDHEGEGRPHGRPEQGARDEGRGGGERFARHERDERAPRGGYHDDRDADHVELFIPVGDNRRVTPADLVGAIAHAADIPGRAIGKIRILERVSFVGLPAELAEQVIERAETLQIRGMKVAVLRARPSGSDARAPARGGPGGGKPRRR